MKKYKLKSREFITQFWEKLGVDMTEDYFIENEFKIFTYTTEEIINIKPIGLCVLNTCLNGGNWIIPIECLQAVYKLKIL